MNTTEPKTVLEQFTVVERAVLYARVSKDDRSQDGRNLQGQLDMGREDASQKGYLIVAELAEDDRGASGAAIDLPQLNRVRDMARAGQFDVLVVRELDRLSRNLAKQLIIEEELNRAGVRIEYVLADYDDTPEGNLQKHIRATVAEYEREKIKERMVRGRRNKIKAGKVIIHRKSPYGYACNAQSLLEIIEDEAQIIKLVFYWYTRENLSIYSIKQKLIQMRTKTPSGTKEWSTASVHRILKSETYAGVWYYGKKAHNKLNPRESWLAVEVPPIVDRAVWEVAQLKLAQNKIEAKRNRKHKYLLSNRVTCGCCGYRMSGCSKKGKSPYLYYYCPAVRLDHSARECNLPMFRADKIDAKVWGWVKEFIEHPELVEAGLKRRQEKQEEESAPLRIQLEIAEDKIAKERRKLARWKEMCADELITKEELAEYKAQCEQTINSLEKQRAELKATLEAAAMSAEEIRAIVDGATRLKQEAQEVKEGLNIADASFEEKRWFIERLNVRIRLVIENGQKIAYARCSLDDDEKRLPIASHTLGNAKRNLYGFVLTARLVIE